MNADVVVIGGGPAGLAAALAAHEEQIDNILLLERDFELGGILPQCIHDGFGNFFFGEMLTGPEYAQRFATAVERSDIEVMLNTMVLEMDSSKHIVAANPDRGLLEIEANSIILAMGCRERTRSQILISGDRPSGIYTAGVAQRYINMEGLMPGKKVVILGSGDVGLIMARRFHLEGAEVEGVYEILPHPGGLTRNVVQCLHDYGIPLHLSHTITKVEGRKRVEGVTVAQVDAHWNPIKETQRYIPCDTVILSVGLIPENELSRSANIEIDPRIGGPLVDERMETSIPGIFACGNVVHVHDLVDDVSEAGKTAGVGAADYVKGKRENRESPITVNPGRNVNYVVPHMIRGNEISKDIMFYFRVKKIEKNVRIALVADGTLIKEKKERIVRPPEMIKINLSPDEIGSIEEELKIEVDKK